MTAVTLCCAPAAAEQRRSYLCTCRFGLGYWATSKLMQSDPEQAMPITAVQAATVAGVSLLWMLVAGLLNGSLIDGTLLQGTEPSPCHAREQARRAPPDRAMTTAGPGPQVRRACRPWVRCCTRGS